MLGVLNGGLLPPRALVIDQILQGVPVFAKGGEEARVFIPWAPVRMQPFNHLKVPSASGGKHMIVKPLTGHPVVFHSSKYVNMP